jgi:outer membrane immunogenic protein
MKKLFLSSVAFAALTVGTALAADMPRKAPVYAPPPPPVLSWNGFYAGLNAGYGWGNNDGINNDVTSIFCNPLLGGCAPNVATNAITAAIPGVFDTSPKGFIGGGQIGYNWQWSPQFVWGIEADFQGADIKGDATVANTVAIVGFAPSTVTVTGTGSQKLNFLGTVRGRLGWLAVPQLLIYGTGG